MNKKWQIYEADTEETNRIAEKYKINKLLASIIVNRKIKDEDIEKFLHPTRQNFHDPFLMPDMDIAVDRIIKAIEKYMYYDNEADRLLEAVDNMLLNNRTAYYVAKDVVNLAERCGYEIENPINENTEITPALRSAFGLV